MPDNNNKNSESIKQNETHKKHSFFWWEINEKTKDLLDFRYNTQEEIDRLNEEMTTTEDLDEIMKQTNNPLDNENTDIEDERDLKENNPTLTLEEDQQTNNEWFNNDTNNYESTEPIEWEIIENTDKEENNIEPDNNNIEENIDLETRENMNDMDENKDEKQDNNIKEQWWESTKFFDPFELNFNENEEILPEWDGDNFNPSILDEEQDKDQEKNEEQNEEENEENNEEQNEEQNNEEQNEEENNEEQNEEENNEEQNEEQGIKIEVKHENETEKNNEDKIDLDDQPTKVSPKNKENTKYKKIRRNSATWETISDEEIELEQWQDMPNDEDDEEYQLSDEELFEQEPEFFAKDELSQQFMQLIQNVRWIFKLERKDWEQNPYFKILGWKTENSILEYLFYLIEEKDEPIDLYIKKVEIYQENEQENEHLVQFSYNEDKELNVFVDEVILYERINKSSPDTPEYNDTKTILEKFIFLTENQYNKLKSEIDKQREEKQKKRQLQQIFKGF